MSHTITSTAAAAPTDERLRTTCRREHPHCFACSEPAEGGLGLHFRVGNDGIVGAHWTCPVGGESYPGIVHGGLVATLLDAAMIHALFALGVVARTAELKIRYRNPVCIGSPVAVTAMLTRQCDPLFVLHAELRQGASLCAEADAKFMRIGTVRGVEPQSEVAALHEQDRANPRDEPNELTGRVRRKGLAPVIGR
jgi:acyl-CoA thioesterase FadM